MFSTRPSSSNSNPESETDYLFGLRLGLPTSNIPDEDWHLQPGILGYQDPTSGQVVPILNITKSRDDAGQVKWTLPDWFVRMFSQPVAIHDVVLKTTSATDDNWDSSTIYWEPSDDATATSCRNHALSPHDRRAPDEDNESIASCSGSQRLERRPLPTSVATSCIPLSKTLIRYMLDNAARWYAFATDDMGYDIDERDMLLVTGVTRIETQDVEALLRAQPPSAPVERRRWSVSAHALAQEVGLGLLGGIEYTYGLPVGSLAPALSSLWHIVVTPQNSSDVGFGFVPYFMSNNKRGHFKKTFIHYYKMRRVSLWRDWVYDPVVSAIADLAPSDSERVRPAYNPVDDLLRYIARRSPLADAVIASDVDVYKLFEHLECSPTRTPHEMRDALERLSPEVGYIELGAFKRVAALKIVCDELGKAEEFGVENLRTSHQPKS